MANYDLSDLGQESIGQAPSHDLSDLGGSAADFQAQKIPTSMKIKMALEDYLKGTAKGAAKPIVQTSNWIDELLNKAPGVNIPTIDTGALAPKTKAEAAGEPLGQALTFLAGGELAAPEAIATGTADVGGQVASKGASFLKSLVSKPVARTAYTSGFGAATSPDNRAKGAEVGALLGGAGEAIPSALTGLAKKAFSPGGTTKLAKDILTNISSGLHDVKPTSAVEDIGKNVAQDVKDTYKDKIDTYKKMINPVMEKAGDQSIYSYEPYGLPGSYSDIPYQIPESYIGKIKKVHENFLRNPNFENAHALQSQLGSTIRTTKPNSIADHEIISNYGDARTAIKSDMDKYLAKHDKTGSLLNQYKSSAKFYHDEAVSYTETPAIKKIAKGEITNPRNVIGTFRNPNENVNQVVEDMGDKTKNNIVYTELGKNQKEVDPQTLLNSYDRLGAKGVSNYITPDLEKQMDILRSKMHSKNLLERTGGAIVGSNIMRGLLGAHGMPDLAGAFWGAARAPTIIKEATSGFNPVTGLISKLLQRAYPTLRGVAASQLAGGQQ